MITNYVYPEMSTPDYSQIMIPIVDNVRIDYLISCVGKQEVAVLLIGEQGVGKTVMMKSYMKKSNPEQHLSRSFNFSSATTPYQFQVRFTPLGAYEGRGTLKKWITRCRRHFQGISTKKFENSLTRKIQVYITAR